jgi:hypothetical protein
VGVLADVKRGIQGKRASTAPQQDSQRNRGDG